MIYKLLFLLLIVHVTLGKSKQREGVRQTDEDTIDLDNPGPSMDHLETSDAAQVYSGQSDYDGGDDDEKANDEGENPGSADDEDESLYSGDQESRKPCLKQNQELEAAKSMFEPYICSDDGYFELKQKRDGKVLCMDRLGERKDCPDPPITQPTSTVARFNIQTLNDSEKPPKDSEPPSSALRSSFLGHPGLLAAIIGGAVVGLLCAVLLVMFLVYRMKKKDEGSYALDEPSKRGRSPAHMGYQKAPSKEYYA